MVGRSRKLSVEAFKTSERGASGLDVNGMRPTSPAAWNIMREQLRARKVCALYIFTSLQMLQKTLNMSCLPQVPGVELPYKALGHLQVKMTSQQEVLFAQEKGIPIIDIRPPEEYIAAHIPG